MHRDFARHLRKNMTDTERRLWHAIRGRQLGGWKFRRQAPLGPFTVDFVSFEARLVLELDGGQHADRKEEDAARSAWLESQGFRVLRFWNHELFEDLDAVLGAIWQALQGRSPPPQPSPIQGEGARG